MILTKTYLLLSVKDTNELETYDKNTKFQIYLLDHLILWNYSGTLF